MGDEAIDPEAAYEALSAGARLALLRNPEGIMPPQFIGQVMTVCGNSCVAAISGKADSVPQIALLQGPLSDYLAHCRCALDTWWNSLTPPLRAGIRCREAIPETLPLQLPDHSPWADVSTPCSPLLVRDYLELQATGGELM
ncbi:MULTISPECIES: hypothetical protein [Rhodococcus]|jgi:hypothetical protein|uniref:Uncharacterized protein n=1 Tax=Rhodococcus oxybenzonivorans TaxID=1990687 RepID=A0AAE4V2D0_9NOCA|nr:MULTISPECIES: hypothetical protein [Rhodococcus]MDV7242308.1 hypothetical protein [Rhodococcus oxybenzonivorans]MDV7266553.1 hypothetical protein [Rhodococcus oxybenzonivorans]MDV7277055.1 hypothetical protein [Rhodococcus oxybenzonivorans]MDV7331796.1 hypothetical protein [Rhodococcus oxybenzonivorans]MDV7344018.1 hypothetical protein [Rhodococcus oxybenzonivorans]